MKSRWSRFALLIAMGALSLALLACSSDEAEDETSEEATASAEATEGEMASASAVAATLSEFAVAVDHEKVAAGEVTFTANNTGAIPHELVVVKTDEAADALPVAEAKVNEDEVEVIGRTAEIASGASEDLKLTLEAGNYVLICNIAGHYEGGMRTSFTVE